MTTVVTWQSPTGATINVCEHCEARLTAGREWPTDSTGQEYCTVSHGLHEGQCDICEAEDEA